MDIEQLKLVVEVVKSVSGDASSVALAYIGLQMLVPLAQTSIICLTLYKVFKVVVGMFQVEKRGE